MPTCEIHPAVTLVCPACAGARSKGRTSARKRRTARQNLVTARAQLDLRARTRARLDDQAGALDPWDPAAPLDAGALHAGRVYAFLTQAELAERLGVSRAAVSAWEAGRRALPAYLVPTVRRIFARRIRGRRVRQ